MMISDERWNDIIAETRSRIDNWNARARERKLSDTFIIDVRDNGGYTCLLTRHSHNPENDMHWDAADYRLVVREIATGEVRSAKVRRRKGRVIGFEVRKPDPQAWQLLVDKSTTEIVKRFKLTNFILFIGSSMMKVQSTARTGECTDDVPA
jgi:hypothetical protein